MAGTARTPAASYLFEVDELATKLDEDVSNMYPHHNTAKLLFLCKRARPDTTQTAVAFLSTRVKSPDNDDYKILARTLKYLRGTL